MKRNKGGAVMKRNKGGAVMKRGKRLLIVATAAIVFSLVLILVPVMGPLLPAQAAITWTRSDTNPVLEEGTSGAWDAAGVGAASVIKDGSTYKMWYTGLATGPVPAFGYATSSNGRSWTKDTANNPVLTKGSGTDFDEEGVGSGTVIKDGSTYKMWYTGYTDAGSNNVPAIGYATSSNGISWTKSGSNPVLTKGTSGAWDDAGVLSAIVIKESDTSYKMWYTGRAAEGDIGNLQLGYATSSNGVSWAR